MLTSLTIWVHVVPTKVLSQVLHETYEQVKRQAKLEKKYPNPMEKIWSQISHRLGWEIRKKLKETIDKGAQNE